MAAEICRRFRFSNDETGDAGVVANHMRLPMPADEGFHVKRFFRWKTLMSTWRCTAWMPVLEGNLDHWSSSANAGKLCLMKSDFGPRAETRAELIAADTGSGPGSRDAARVEERS